MRKIAFMLIMMVIASIPTKAEAYFHDIKGKGDGLEIYKVYFNKKSFEKPEVEVLKPTLAWTSIIEEDSYFIVSFSTATFEVGRKFHFRVNFNILNVPSPVLIDIVRIKVQMTRKGIRAMISDYGETIFFEKKNTKSPQKHNILATTLGNIKNVK